MSRLAAFRETVTVTVAVLLLGLCASCSASGNSAHNRTAADVLSHPNLQLHLAQYANALGISSKLQQDIVAAAQTHGRHLVEIPCFDSCLDYLYFENMDFCTMIDYNACPVGTSVADAETQAKAAYDAALADPDYNGVPDCQNALRLFSCATYFPKCEWNAVSYSTCHSVCENMFKACSVAQGTSCDGYSGVGPAADCTGGAAGTAVSVAVLLAGMLAAVGATWAA